MDTQTITIRPATPADIPSLLAIHHASAAERGLSSTTTEEDYHLWFAEPNFNRETDTRVAELDGRIVASANVQRQDAQANGGGNVLSEYRGRGIGSTLVAWIIERARAYGDATEVMTWVPAENRESCELVESFGFTHTRTFRRMLNTEPSSVAEPEWPPGITVRTLEASDAVDAACDAWDGSFIDHFNFHPAKRDEWAHYVHNDPKIDLSLWFFAYETDVLAGFCLNQADRAADGVLRGDLGPIGTMRSHRGIGLGRALLRHSVRALAERGCTEIELGVDTENPNGAVRLYESNGFAVTHEGRAYLLSL